MKDVHHYSQATIDTQKARFMSGVYGYMTMGVLLTALISYFITMSPELISLVIGNKAIFTMIMLLEVGLVIFLSSRINKIEPLTATILFFVYAALNGVTFSVILLAYTQTAIDTAFFITSFAFAGLSAFGYFTKKDLGPVGTFCIMGLWGLIGFSLLSFFFPGMIQGQMGMVYSMAGLLIFCGLTAFDTQRIKNSYIAGSEGGAMAHRLTIMGALKLYLDFINIFLFVLRLLGGRRR